ncbi:MAG: hypothetical protein V8S95_06760 [Odoribacter sp.]
MSHFAVNYYERSMGTSLGTMPQRIFRNYKPIEALFRFIGQDG